MALLLLVRRLVLVSSSKMRSPVLVHLQIRAGVGLQGSAPKGRSLLLCSETLPLLTAQETQPPANTGSSSCSSQQCRQARPGWWPTCRMQSSEEMLLNSRPAAVCCWACCTNLISSAVLVRTAMGTAVTAVGALNLMLPLLLWHLWAAGWLMRCSRGSLLLPWQARAAVLSRLQAQQQAQVVLEPTTRQLLAVPLPSTNRNSSSSTMLAAPQLQHF